MRYIIIDLEWNGAFSGKLGKYFNEIIEIGAVALNEKLETVDEFSMLVSPTFNRKLSGRVKRLTHISNSEVSTGLDFRKAMATFTQWVGKDENCFLSFGTGDILVMLENFEVYGMGSTLGFMDAYCDLQQLCQYNMDDVDAGQQLGLSALAERLGIEVGDMDMHRALDDSIVSAECLRRSFDSNVFSSLRHTADTEFYNWLNFKTVPVLDLDHYGVNICRLMQTCPECGVILKRTTAFNQKSRGFVAQFVCGKCGRKYSGKHYIKLKYEGLVYRSTLSEVGASPLGKENEE